MNMKSRMLAAALVGMLTATERPRREVLVVDEPDPPALPPPEPPKPAQASYDPVLGREDAKRQGERLARQKLDFSASDKCIARIRERLAKRAAPEERDR